MKLTLKQLKQLKQTAINIAHIQKMCDGGPSEELRIVKKLFDHIDEQATEIARPEKENKEQRNSIDCMSDAMADCPHALECMGVDGQSPIVDINALKAQAATAAESDGKK